MADRLDELAQLLAGMAREVKSLKASRSNLAVLDGQVTSNVSVALEDEDGNPVLDDEGLAIVTQVEGVSIGVQPDGSQTVVHTTGLKPWTPTVPSCVGSTGSISVTWDGHYMDDPETDIDESREAYADFARVEVHAGLEGTSQTLDYSLGSSTRRGTIETVLGGSVALSLPAGTYWVALVAVNRANEYGEPSYSVNVASLEGGLSDEDMQVIHDLIQASSDGKNSITYSVNDASTAGTASGDIWYKYDAGNGVILAQWVWDGTTWKPVALSSNVIASLDVGKLTSGIISAGVKISTGPADDDHTEISSDGFTVLRKSTDPEDTTMRTAIQMGRSGAADRIQIFDATGAALAGFDSDGKVTGTSLEIAGIDSDGDGQADTGFQVFGKEFLDHLSPLSQGIIASAFASGTWTSPQVTSSSGEVGLGEIGFTQEMGRAYSVHFSGIQGIVNSGAGAVVTRLRFTSDGSAPTITSPILEMSITDARGGAGSLYTTIPLDAYGVFANGRADIRVLVTVSATGTLNWSNQIRTDGYRKVIRFWVRDEGLDVLDVWQPSYGDGNYATGTATPKPAAIKKTYVTTWGASSGQCYNGAGSPISKAGQMQQGYYSGTNGNTKSLIFFAGANSTGSETNKTITQALSGAQVKKVEVRLYPVRWYYGSGGTGVVGMWSQAGSSPPGSFSGGSMGGVQSANWAAGQERWVTLSLANAVAAIGSGSRGVLVGPGPSNSLTYYGAFAGPGQAHPPAIRITYTK